MDTNCLTSVWISLPIKEEATFSCKEWRWEKKLKNEEDLETLRRVSLGSSPIRKQKLVLLYNCELLWTIFVPFCRRRFVSGDVIAIFGSFLNPRVYKCWSWPSVGKYVDEILRFTSKLYSEFLISYVPGTEDHNLHHRLKGVGGIKYCLQPSVCIPNN